MSDDRKNLDREMRINMHCDALGGACGNVLGGSEMQASPRFQVFRNVGELVEGLLMRSGVRIIPRE
jgi:hypothetical protein